MIPMNGYNEPYVNESGIIIRQQGEGNAYLIAGIMLLISEKYKEQRPKKVFYVFVYKVSLKTCLWQSQGQNILKVLLCFYMFWRLMDQMEQKLKVVAFWPKVCGRAIARPFPFLARTDIEVFIFVA